MTLFVNDQGDWHNSYCGPAAVSIVTGAATCDVAKAVNHRFRDWDSRIRGMWHNEMVWAVRHFGRKIHRVTPAAGYRTVNPKTLREYLYGMLPEPGYAYIISAGHHYQTYWGGLIIDNWGTAPVEEHDHLKRWFKAAWAVDMTRRFDKHENF